MQGRVQGAGPTWSVETNGGGTGGEAESTRGEGRRAFRARIHPGFDTRAQGPVPALRAHGEPAPPVPAPVLLPRVRPGAADVRAENAMRGGEGERGGVGRMARGPGAGAGAEGAGDAKEEKTQKRRRRRRRRGRRPGRRPGRRFIFRRRVHRASRCAQTQTN